MKDCFKALGDLVMGTIKAGGDVFNFNNVNSVSISGSGNVVIQGDVVGRIATDKGIIVNVDIQGDVSSITTQGAVNVTGNVTNSINTQGQVIVEGDINGNVITQGRVSCHNVNNINTMGKVEVEGNCKGNIDTMGKVNIYNKDKK
jgi:cytoskeletal protein CcmA (bactofilin family)